MKLCVDGERGRKKNHCVFLRGRKQKRRRKKRKKEEKKKNGFTETRTQDPVCVRHM